MRGAHQVGFGRLGRQLDGAARLGLGGGVVQGAQQHGAGPMESGRGRAGATLDGRGAESLGRRAEVGRQRGPAVRQDGQVLGAVEPGKLVDPAQGEQGPDPEPFAAGARLATVGAGGVLLRAFQATECEPGQGAAREDLIGSLGHQPQQGREIQLRTPPPGRASARARRGPSSAWSSRGSSTSKAEYSARARSTKPASTSSLARLSRLARTNGVARPRRGDDRFVGRPGSRVVAEALFHEAEVEPGLEEVGPLGRGQGTIHVVAAPDPNLPGRDRGASGWIVPTGNRARSATAA